MCCLRWSARMHEMVGLLARSALPVGACGMQQVELMLVVSLQVVG